MVFLIRSIDGRFSVCTPSAKAAVGHVQKLEQLGHAVTLTDINGRQYDLSRSAKRVRAPGVNLYASAA